MQELLGPVRHHVDASHEARRSQLLTTQPAQLDGTLHEIVVSDGHVRLARCLRDRVAFSAACGTRESKGTRLLPPKEVYDLSSGHRPCKCAPQLRTPFLQASFHKLLARTHVSPATSAKMALGKWRHGAPSGQAAGGARLAGWRMAPCGDGGALQRGGVHRRGSASTGRVRTA